MPLKGQAKIDYQREYMRSRRAKYGNGLDYKRRVGSCESCGFSGTVDLHHEGINREEHILCPNCHSLITRKIKTLAEVLSVRPLPVRPIESVRPIVRPQEPPKVYHPGVHYEPGQTIVVGGVRCTVPQLDADGNLIPE